MTPAWVTPAMLKIGAVVAIAIALFAWHKYSVSVAYEAGRTYERLQAIDRAAKLNEKREKNLEDLSRYSVDQLSCELIGGLWKNNECRH